jgi:pyruvate formate lyase activating enzyme
MGIKYCYVGNVHNIEGQTTFCPGCGENLISRDWHTVISDNLTDGRCENCKTLIEGVFK